MTQGKTGKVYLIGAGPGDPGLITVRGREALRQAEVVVYDYLANAALLREAKPGAEIIYVGKSASQHTMSQDKINLLLVELGRAGKVVARLKGGDPFVFGRGGEEAEVLRAADIAFEIVPGISSAIAVPAYAGIPLTHRDFVSSFTVITGHSGPPVAAQEEKLDWQALANASGTLVLLMGVNHLGQIATRLIEAGKSPALPVAVVRWGTTWQQETVTGTLANIAQLVKAAGIKPPAVTIIGEVAGLRERLQWWDKPEVRPLLGKRVVVTRTREQASSLLAKLTELGADALEFPTIKIIAPESFGPLDDAITQLGQYDWVIFTSVNGVDYFMARLKQAGKDARAFGQAKVCAIGPATAARLEEANIRADFMPSKFVAESILAELGEVSGQHILLARADVARDALREGLTAQGAQVDNVVTYRQVIGSEEDSPTSLKAAELVALLEAGEIDLVTFTSSNTVRNFATRLATASDKPLTTLLQKSRIACIGPITAGTAREMGLAVDIEADEFTIDGLLEVISRQVQVISS